jgi:hypothetical protein
MTTQNNDRRLGLLDEARSDRYRRGARLSVNANDSKPRADFKVTFASGVSVEVTNISRDAVEDKAIAFLVRERRLRQEIICVEELPENPGRHAERLKQEPVRYKTLSTIRET